MDFFDHLASQGTNWYHSNKPLDKQQRKELAKHFGILQHHVDSTENGKTPKPKIAVNKKYTYFVFHIPYLPANSNKFFISELNVFVFADTLITIESQGGLQSLKSYFTKTKESKKILTSRLKHGPANLFLNLIRYILTDIELNIDDHGEKVDQLNKKIFKSSQAKRFIEVISILRYNQIVAFSAIERQSRAMEGYATENNPVGRYMNTDDHKWFVIIETFQTLSYDLANDIQHLEGLVKTFETLVTHRTNETIKILTLFSVVMLPLGVISGVYGMNFRFIPLSQEPLGFWFILSIMGIIFFSMLLAFKIKKWL